MFELAAMFLIIIGAVSTLMGFSASTFVYSFLIMSILILTIGAVKGGKRRTMERN